MILGKQTPRLPTFIAVLIIMVATAACSSGPSQTSSSSTTQPTGSPTATAQAITINLVAQNLAFDTKTIVVPPGAKVTINFDNKDSGIMHNFSLYSDSTAKTSLFKGDFVTGPSTKVYTFTAPTKVGDYFFRCDVHPTTMTGTFVVE